MRKWIKLYKRGKFVSHIFFYHKTMATINEVEKNIMTGEKNWGGGKSSVNQLVVVFEVYFLY